MDNRRRVVVLCGKEEHGLLVVSNIEQLAGADVKVTFTLLTSLAHSWWAIFNPLNMWNWWNPPELAACVIVCVPIADQIIILLDQTNEPDYGNVLKQAHQHSRNVVIAIVDPCLEAGEDWREEMSDLIEGQPRLAPYRDGDLLWLVGRSFTQQQSQLLQGMLEVQQEELPGEQPTQRASEPLEHQHARPGTSGTDETSSQAEAQELTELADEELAKEQEQWYPLQGGADGEQEEVPNPCCQLS